MINQDDLTLVETSVDLADELRAYADDYARVGEGHYLRRVALGTLADVAAFVADLRRQSEGRDLPPNQVPQTSYWLRRADGTLVGASRLRHRLNPGLEIEGGHIDRPNRQSGQSR
jgi:predicted acetyltransferase